MPGLPVLAASTTPDDCSASQINCVPSAGVAAFKLILIRLGVPSFTPVKRLTSTSGGASPDGFTPATSNAFGGYSFTHLTMPHHNLCSASAAATAASKSNAAAGCVFGQNAVAAAKRQAARRPSALPTATFIVGLSAR